MIYLIGGPPRCGKTTLAEALAARTALPYFTLDHVTAVISPYIPERDYAERLPLRVAREQTNFSNDAFYARYSADEIVEIYSRQAKTYWPGVESFVRYAIDDGHDLILEGWQLLANLVHTVVTPETRDRVRALFLYKLDAEKIASGLRASTAKNDWVIKNTRDDATFTAIAEMIRRFSRQVRSETKEYNLPSVNTDSEFAERLAQALDSLTT